MDAIHCIKLHNGLYLFEVVYWGSNGDPNAEDTVFIVRAKSVESAAEIVDRYEAYRWRENMVVKHAQAVYLLGIETAYVKTQEEVIAGPFFKWPCVAHGRVGAAMMTRIAPGFNNLN